MTVGSGGSKKGRSWQGVEAEGISSLLEMSRSSSFIWEAKGKGTERFKGGEL